jgi:hypothetical protein
VAADLKLKAGAIPSGSISTVLSTEFNSLANNAGTAASSAVDQATNLDQKAYFELNVTFGSAPAAGTTVDLYLMYSLDGTNYADYTSGTTPVVNANNYVGSFVLANTTSAQRVHSPDVYLRAYKFKVAAVNKSGVAFPASGSTCKLVTEIAQSV